MAPATPFCFWTTQKHLTPIGKPPPLAVRLAEALPFRRAQGIEGDGLSMYDRLQTAEGSQTHTQVALVSGEAT